ncbi:CCG-binding protein 1 [Phalaenopsis equestris]|uniref:CCG-binding protein 1 n=1 Tax=Phalaenopsis equestris TaxID=78828 RepID=UPI0009E6548B|nr:CCG-binding protein 1 [Phalaenopsis equestris]
MLRSLAPPTSAPPLLFDSAAGDLSRCRPARPAAACCSGQRSSAYIPKLEPFSRSKIDRRLKDPPFLQKFENDLTDYCSTLEGDKAYSCWMAYFKLKDLEEEMTREQVEKFVRQAGGVKSFIGCLHGLTAMLKNDAKNQQKHIPSNFKAEKEAPVHVPDGIPKTKQELEEEENGKMPDSSFTRLLRTMGRAPAWYSQAPDHEM